MKIIFITLLLAISASMTLAQGLVIFANSPTTLVSAGSVGQSAPISGPPGSYYFGLLFAHQGTTDPGQFTFTGVYATNRGSSTLAGLLDGGEPMVTGWAPGTSMSFLVAGWSANLGHDWKDQWLNSNFAASGLFSLSPIATGVAGGPLGGVPAAPIPLFGGTFIPGFNLNPVPEPSAVALLALSAIALMLTCRTPTRHPRMATSR
jgi:hypothetical protein